MNMSMIQILLWGGVPAGVLFAPTGKAEVQTFYPADDSNAAGCELGRYRTIDDSDEGAWGTASVSVTGSRSKEYGEDIPQLWVVTEQEDPCTWSPANCWYGDGSDGDVVISPGHPPLQRDVNYRNLTVEPGATLDTAGFVVRVCGTLTNHGQITDWQSGGEGGDGGSVPDGVPDGPGRGENPYVGNPCRIGDCGDPGDPPSVPQAGYGGGGGCQGSGGGGGARDQDCILKFDADGGWCASCGPTDQNDKGKGGNGGRGGGYVRIWAFDIDNMGSIHADGENGQVGGEGSNGEYYAYPELSPIYDVCGGGQGGGAGGDGAEGGTLLLKHPRPSDSLGLYGAAGGDGGPGGDGGQGGHPPIGGCGLRYGVEQRCGYSGPGCDPTCCSQCDPRPCWNLPGCDPCCGNGAGGEWRQGYCCGDGGNGDPGCDGPGGTVTTPVTRPGDTDHDVDEDEYDYYAFVGCYPPPNGGPVAPGCEVFDFDCDGDIDPDDWGAFKRAWTGPPEEIPTDICCLSDPHPGCQDVHVIDCYLAGGIPIYPGTACAAPEPCCLPDGDSVDVDPLCCDVLDGEPRPDPPVCEPTVPDQGCGTRQRYLSFSGGTPGGSEAVRVTWASGSLAGMQMWVGPPFQVSESSGDDGPTPPPAFYAAPLQCEPYATDWSTYPSVHVFHEAIGPSTTYEVQLVAAACTAIEENYSDPLLITTSMWGDLVGLYDPGACVTMYNGYEDCWTPPDCDVDFDDIAAMVDKFKNFPGAPHKSRCDIAPQRPDQVCDFVDIPHAVDAFSGLPYPWPKTVDPCARK